MFLLDLRTLDPARPLYSYVQELNKHFGLLVSYQSISDWFKKCWDFNGSLWQENLVPLDKWKARNKLRYYEFVQKLHIYSNDHSKYSFIDEKHIYNKDVADAAWDGVTSQFVFMLSNLKTIWPEATCK
jgi:hypothetical protein